MNATLTKPETTPNGRTQPAYLTPRANISETADGYMLAAEMPGVSKDGLHVTVENGQLVIAGTRTPWKSEGTVLHRETRDFDYRRVFELDPSIDATKISAKMEQGVLKLHLPKAESVKPRKIAVK
jgi:HSP20 family protein